MRLGMPVLVEFHNLESNLCLAKELCLDFIELNMNLPICTPESIAGEELKRLSEKFGIAFTIHLPEELDLFSFHDSIRKGHLERCLQTFEWARKAGIETLNMHVNKGIAFTLPDRKVWINEKYEEKVLPIFLDSCSELAKHAEGLKLCLENTMNFHIPYVARAVSKALKQGELFLTWDVGHDARADFQEEAFFFENQERIRHMHMHDYSGGSDHQPLYSGIVPIDDRLKLAEEKDLSVVIEVKTSDALTESVQRIRGNRR